MTDRHLDDIEATLQRMHEAEARADAGRCPNCGGDLTWIPDVDGCPFCQADIDRRTAYVPVEDDPTVPTDLTAAQHLDRLDEILAHANSPMPTLSEDDPEGELDEWGRLYTVYDPATARIRADYQPRRRVWPWRAALVLFLLIAVAFVAVSVYTVATTPPTAGPTWNGEF